MAVSLTSPNLMGTRSFVSDANGEFRFPALPPGTYALKAELAGFGTHVQESIRLTTTTTLNIDIVLKPAAVAEEVTVVAQSPTGRRQVRPRRRRSRCRARSCGTSPTASSRRTSSTWPRRSTTTPPTAPRRARAWPSRWTASGSATRPAARPGSSSDHNTIEEAKVMGVGLPAEYGNFTGRHLQPHHEVRRQPAVRPRRVPLPGQADRQAGRPLADRATTAPTPGTSPISPRPSTRCWTPTSSWAARSSRTSSGSSWAPRCSRNGGTPPASPRPTSTTSPGASSS
ncbi:MAG: carboxypeptidase-like regulatory domain-containing protein [Anaerotruncus sp.]|nr:carboxypeptidase-like regulatory domain-containing protein [Anaerotruncus sp.]